MYIVGLVDHPKHVCARYRLGAFKPHWEAAGHRLELQAIPKGFFSRLRLWWSLGDADLVILQRRLISGLHLMLLRRNVRRLVFDFDDAVFQRDSYHARKHEASIRLRRFTAAVHAADHIVAGNTYLRQEAARFVDHSRITVVPTCIEPDNYPTAVHDRKGKGIQLVWIGSGSTLQGLEQRRSLWDTIAAHVPGLQFKVICDGYPRFKIMPVLPVAWSEETEAAELASADIGISWVPEDRWSLGKCGLKVLQYMAAGLPVVANAVGVQARMVRHGETGYLAQTPAQWVDAIHRLARDPELRFRLGQAGRKLVERKYGVTRGAQLWLRVFQTVSPARSKFAA